MIRYTERNSLKYVVFRQLRKFAKSKKSQRLAFEEISAKTGITSAWLCRFHQNPNYNVGVDFIEKLYFHFNGTTVFEKVKV